jgi:ribosomal protein L11 methyltransferase
MSFIELKCVVNPVESGNEILIAFLVELGYESFLETENGLSAYIPKSLFDRQKLELLMQDSSDLEFTFSYSFENMEDKNWNAVWESNYEPVLIDNTCSIRAPFHPKKDVDKEIILEPKMSFGTAHDPTTSQMISYLLEEDCAEKNVLDMGAGTGILAILAAMRGAKNVLAIDNDEWAYNNCCENVEKNQINVVKTVLGDANSIENEQYDIILANINRNILLQDMHLYAKALNKNGILLLSGFYLHPDLPVIEEVAKKYNLVMDSYREQENWTAARFRK